LRAAAGDAAGGAAAGRRPNIVVIMVDDMGFSDIGGYGGEIATPNIDRLAAGGLRFTQFYNNAKCGPSRASLFTANYPGWQDRSQCLSWGTAMKAAGYRTYRVGKVHETGGGFDRACTMGPCASYWDLTVEGKTARGGLKIDGVEQPDFLATHPDFYTTDTFTDYALKYLEEGRDDAKPFFLYVAYNAPHYPLHARPADIDRYRGTYMDGWDALRERRYARQQELGLFDKPPALSPRDEQVPAWDSLPRDEQRRQDAAMAVYAAMIDRVDRNIGRLMEKIAALGQADNTLVLFLSDNGGCHQTGAGTPPGSDPGPRGTWHFVGRNWANASNTPFRKFKTWDHEGGISTPLIANWPGRIRAGTFDRDWGNIMDIPATCVDLAGEPNAKVGGLSLAPAFDGRKRDLHASLCWAILKGKAARKGDWKVVRHGDEPWRLFNVAEDRAELHDLAAAEPARLRELAALWDDWSDKCRYIGDDMP
jgi:arylsulfatase